MTDDDLDNLTRLVSAWVYAEIAYFRTEEEAEQVEAKDRLYAAKKELDDATLAIMARMPRRVSRVAEVGPTFEESLSRALLPRRAPFLG